MNRFNKKNIFVFIFGLCSFGLIGFFFTFPTYKTLSENKSTFEKKQAELNTLYEKVDILQKANKNQDEYQKTIETVNALWPANQDVSTFIIQSETMAKSNNTLIENFSITQPTAAKKETSEDAKSTSKTAAKKVVKKSAQFSFSYKAAYPVAYNIIANMETLARFNTINSINLTVNEDGTINTNLVGNIYYGD